MRPSILLTEFDEQTIGQSTQLLKAMVPFLESDKQRLFSIMIRFMELSMTIDYFSHPQNCICSCECCKSINNMDFECLIRMLKDYCDPKMQQELDMFMGLMKANQIKNMAEAFYPNEPITSENGKCNCSNDNKTSKMPADLLYSFLTPKQQELLKEFENKL